MWLINDPVNRPINFSLRKAEYLKLRFNGYEWAQLFYVVFGCPTALEVAQLPNEDHQTWVKRNENIFREHISDFPLLGELNDIYSKILFNLAQVKALKKEIAAIMPHAINNEPALNGLKKLNEACEIAAKKEKFLLLNGG